MIRELKADIKILKQILKETSDTEMREFLEKQIALKELALLVATDFE